ncbi:POT family proton-dependent oligopeptide transporter [Nonomuraea thailandensis]|uniref:POT family proton-dependent oligopeptide transporter n=1 Tax=Nonomuraea thailandensis TaxID=1188745 RepID=A0A9X2GP43_9ACTN|nr:peptide MFS transporter [Nonomuraea thailandensis]MCP2362894.1 POT family proton-dependent oligopeptide transporter [Nonomuraea thailandensis]
MNPPSGTARPQGRPRWLTTLFLADMWERFSFFGMQAIMILFAVAPAEEGGLNLPHSTAVALYGAYVGLIFVLSMPGGWLGDRFLGEHRATLYGGIVIALGHYLMMVPSRPTAYLGLVTIAVGTGLLKPNMLALLGRFYGPDESNRREAALVVFYIGIQISALLAPLVTGFLGERMNWHLGFGAAGLGMTFGVIQYAVGSRRFGTIGRAAAHPASRAELRAVASRIAVAAAVVGVLLTGAVLTGNFAITHGIALVGLVTLTAPFVYFAVLRRRARLSPAESRRLSAFRWVLLSVALFWMFVIQAGSTLSLFAQRHTAREVGGFLVPASWFQAAIPLFILLAAPAVAWLLMRRGGQVSVVDKIAFGHWLAAAGFGVISVAAVFAAGGEMVSPLWLLFVLFTLACGEVILGPTVMSATVDLAPSAFAGRTMALYWMFAGVGGGLGSMLGRLVSAGDPQPVYYLALAVLALLTATGFVLARRRLVAAMSSASPDAALQESSAAGRGSGATSSPS